MTNLHSGFAASVPPVSGQSDDTTILDSGSPLVSLPPKAESLTAEDRSNSVSPHATILVVSADDNTRQTLKQLLHSENYKIVEALDGRSALRLLGDEVSLVLASLELPDLSGRECLAFIQKHHPDIPVILVSRHGEVPDALAALREGAFECLTHSCHPDHLLVQVRQAVRVRHLVSENRGLKEAFNYPYLHAELAGQSQLMRSLREQAETFAKIDSSVLITGPSGCGKTTVAQWLHAHSSRSAAPFVVVNCQHVSADVLAAEIFGLASEDHSSTERPGLLEIADGGTLFFHEISEMSVAVQDRLFEFLETRLVTRVGDTHARRSNVRIIASTTRDLSMLRQHGTLRESFMKRIDVLSLHLPPLRQHLEDTSDIAQSLVQRIARCRGTRTPILTDEAIEALRHYEWPGNITELENVLRHSIDNATEGIITRDNLEQSIHWMQGISWLENHQTHLAGSTLAEIERRAILETMQSCGGNKAMTARRLGVSEKTIYNKIKQYDLRGKTGGP